MSKLNLKARLAFDGRPVGSKCGPGCPAPKANSGEAHCTVCHNHFSGVTHFDSHRVDGYCHNPASVGLLSLESVWSTPEGHEARKVASARMTLARAARSNPKEEI